MGEGTDDNLNTEEAMGSQVTEEVTEEGTVASLGMEDNPHTGRLWAANKGYSYGQQGHSSDGSCLETCCTACAAAACCCCLCDMLT